MNKAFTAEIALSIERMDSKHIVKIDGNGDLDGEIHSLALNALNDFFEKLAHIEWGKNQQLLKDGKKRLSEYRNGRTIKCGRFEEKVIPLHPNMKR